MKAKTLFILFLSIPLSLLAQNSEVSSAIFNIGKSYTGTGDLRGIQYGILYQKYFKEKQLYWNLGFEGTFHEDESIDYIFEDENGNELTGKSRYITTGLQFIGTIGYDILKNPDHNLGFAIGPIFRYQSSTIPDMVEILYPAITDLPAPIKIERFTEPFRTLSIGATLRLNYNYVFQNSFLLGFTGGFQLDTNADTIAHIALSVGKKF